MRNKIKAADAYLEELDIFDDPILCSAVYYAFHRGFEACKEKVIDDLIQSENENDQYELDCDGQSKGGNNEK